MTLFRCVTISMGTFGLAYAAHYKSTRNNTIYAKESIEKRGGHLDANGEGDGHRVVIGGGGGGRGHGHAVVIGGGVIGLSSALRLAEAGCDVTVVEAANTIAAGTSRINGAILCPSMVTCWANAGLMYQRKYVRKSMKVSRVCWTDPAFYRWAAWFWFNTFYPGRLKSNNSALLELAHYSMQCLEQEEAKYGDILGQNKTAKATLKLFQEEGKMDSFLQSELVKFWTEKGYSFDQLSVEECLKLEPALAGLDARTGVPDNSDLVGGVRCSTDSSGDIAVYCNNVYKECQRRGVNIRCGAKVDKLEVHQGKVTGVMLEGGEVVRGDKFVIAAGVGSSQIAATAGLNLPIIPIKGHLASVASSQGEPSLRFTIDSHKHGLIAPLAPNVLRLSSGMEIVGHEYSVDEEKGKLMVKSAAGVLKEGYICQEGAAYDCGLRPVSADDVPIIGETHIGNLWVNTGHGSKGWTLSWGSASLIASLMCGHTTAVDPTRYSPRRFHPCRRLISSQK